MAGEMADVAFHMRSRRRRMWANIGHVLCACNRETGSENETENRMPAMHPLKVVHVSSSKQNWQG
jgi:hypothetical protein